MIITRSKNPEAIARALARHRKVAVVGCGLCATTCETGGEKEVRGTADRLAAEGKLVLAELMVEGVCHKRLLELQARREKERLAEAEAVLVLACGSGVQTAGEVFEPPVFAGLDTLFLGQIRRHGDFREVCSLCGDCLLGGDTSICPITRCPKALVNGPCGGAQEGACEVNQENPCVWVEIYEERKRRGTLEDLKEILAPRDHSRHTRPGHVKVSRG
jgi:ferredoxin